MADRPRLFLEIDDIGGPNGLILADAVGRVPAGALPPGSAFGYQPTLLGPEAPWLGREWAWRGDSFGVADTGAGLPPAVMHNELVPARLQATKNTIQHVGGSTASDVVLRMVQQGGSQWQDESNPNCLLPGQVVVTNFGTNDAAMGGFFVGAGTERRPAAYRAYADGVEAFLGLVQSRSARSNWVRTGTWSDLAWSVQAPGTSSQGFGQAKITTQQGAKASITFPAGIGAGATMILLAPVDGTGTNYTARIRRASEPASAARAVKTDTTIDHGYGGAGTQLGAPYSPVPVTWRDTAGEFSPGDSLVFEVENLAAAPLIVVSVHPWNGTPDVRMAPPLLLSPAAFAAVARAPQPEYRSSNEVISTWFRPVLYSLVAAIANPKIKAIPARLYDGLFSWMEEGLRQPDLVHPNPAGQARAAQAVYEGVLGSANGIDPLALAPVTSQALAAKANASDVIAQFNIQNDAIFARPDRQEVGEQVADLTAQIASKADQEAVADQVAAVNTQLGLRPTKTTVDGQIATVNTRIDGIAATGVGKDVTGALPRLHGAIRRRNDAPIILFPNGSSTPAGQAASTEANRFVNKLTAAAQAAYPLASGAAQPATVDKPSSSTPPQLGPGIQCVNYAIPSTTSQNFLSATMVQQMILQSSTKGLAVPLCMVLSNDWSRSTTTNNVAWSKANMRGWIQALRDGFTAAKKPFLIVLLGTFQRLDSTAQNKPPLYPWSDYLNIMRELALEFPDDVVYFDLSGDFRAVGIPGTGDGYDPFDLFASTNGVPVDGVHLGDEGHDLLAEIVRRRLGIPAGAGSSTGGGTTPVTPVTISTITSDSFAGSATTTLAGRQTDIAYGGVKMSYETETPTAYAINGSGQLAWQTAGVTRVGVESFGIQPGKTTMEIDAILAFTGASVFLDLGAASMSVATGTSAIGLWRATLAVDNTLRFGRRPAGAGTTALGSAATALLNSATFAAGVRIKVRLEPITGGVRLTAWQDVAGTLVQLVTVDDVTSTVTPGKYVRVTTTGNVMGTLDALSFNGG
jgi:lysophospholipase L1-like esterase